MPEVNVESAHDNGRWLPRIQAVGGSIATFDTKEQAVDHARQVAVERGVEHIIKDHDGTIAVRHTYPRSSRSARRSRLM